MMSIWKDLPETETNHDISHFNYAYYNSALKLPTIPIRNDLLVWKQMKKYSTGRRHDECIYDLEPAEYTVMICVYPERVSPKLIRIKLEIIFLGKN